MTTVFQPYCMFCEEQFENMKATLDHEQVCPKRRTAPAKSSDIAKLVSDPNVISEGRHRSA